MTPITQLIDWERKMWICLSAGYRTADPVLNPYPLYRKKSQEITGFPCSRRTFNNSWGFIASRNGKIPPPYVCMICLIALLDVSSDVDRLLPRTFKTLSLNNVFCLEGGLHCGKTSLSYISLSSGCWNIDESLVGQLTSLVDYGLHAYLIFVTNATNIFM